MQTVSPIGTQPIQRHRRFVMTERASHEALAVLAVKQPVAAGVLHKLIAYMGTRNAIVVPQHVLATQLGVHPNSIANAIKRLAAEHWIQVVRIGKGKEAAYVVNDRVAWGEPRDHMRFSTFSAKIIAADTDQDKATLNNAPLRKIPTIFRGELQLPSGDGLPPVSQPHLPDMEPDLPALVAEEEELTGAKATLAAIEELRAGRGTRMTFEEFTREMYAMVEEVQNEMMQDA